MVQLVMQQDTVQLQLFVTLNLKQKGCLEKMYSIKQVVSKIM